MHPPRESVGPGTSHLPETLFRQSPKGCLGYGYTTVYTGTGRSECGTGLVALWLLKLQRKKEEGRRKEGGRKLKNIFSWMKRVLTMTGSKAVDVRVLTKK